MRFAIFGFVIKSLLFMCIGTGSIARGANIEIAKNVAKDKDWLGLRLLFKEKISEPALGPNEWREFRRLLQKSPEVGLDVVWSWDNRMPSEIQNSSLVKGLRADMVRAERTLLAKDWVEATTRWMAIAEFMRSKKEFMAENQQTYEYVLHMLGRSLFSSGRYAEAAQIYSFISPGYFRFFQVLYERMWAGFRGEDYSVALGSLASQRSLFGSRFLDPESYVVQIYIMKKLCREDELKEILADLGFLKANIEDKSIDLFFGDLENVVLKNLADPKWLQYPPSYGQSAARKAEQDRLSRQYDKLLRTRRARISKSIDQIEGYAQLAVSGVTQLAKVKIPDSRGSYLKDGWELWKMKKDGEEWLDEWGYHRFMGKSQCR